MKPGAVRSTISTGLAQASALSDRRLGLAELGITSFSHHPRNPIRDRIGCPIRKLHANLALVIGLGCSRVKKVLAWIGITAVGLAASWLYSARVARVADTSAPGRASVTAESPDAIAANSLDLTAESVASGAPTPAARIASDPTMATTAASIPPAPLPPLGTPVAEILDQLKARAAQGDSAATCRLAYELQRCSEAEWARSVSSSLEADLARQPVTPSGAPETLARIQGIAENRGTGCEGVSAADRALAFDLQMKAATARPDLRLWAALNPALDPWNFANELEHWQRYRATAMTWLEQAAAEGDILAVIALQRVHGDLRRNGPPYPRFRVRDDERFVMYTDLLKRYGVEFSAPRRDYEARRAALDPAAISRIERHVAALHQSTVPPINEAQTITALDYSMRNVPEPEDCVPD